MYKPTTEGQLKQARLNQEFEAVPFGVGQCPLKAQEVAIFPVRYALDESPATKGSSQGPNPLPKAWKGEPHALETRSYTLRQLRDGWLYVWNSVDQTFHEYQVQGESFTRHKWTQAQLNQDARHNPGDTHPYLLYPRRSLLRMAYSPVQWTWRLCELMRSSVTAQTQWMREVDLPGFCQTFTIAHGDNIKELGDSVSDILLYGQPAPPFTSTMLPTQPSESQSSFKRAFEDALVRGRVPDQGTALFVALDDPLAMIDDLSLNLSGRLLEYTQFEQMHQQKLESAMAVQNLCGFDPEAFIPASLTDPLQRQACEDDLYTLLTEVYQVELGLKQSRFVESSFPNLPAVQELDRAQNTFKTKWGYLPDRVRWAAVLEEWDDKQLWRADVHFEEVRQYLRQTTLEAQRLQAHCQRSERDLLSWLDRLSPGAEAVYHDTCNALQATPLLNTAEMVHTLLGNGESGQKWLCQQTEAPSTLFGFALFNFSGELAGVIKQVTHNFSQTGSLDDLGREGDGSSPGLSLTSPGDLTNLGTRANEIGSVLDLDAVRNSAPFKAMSSAGRQAMETLVQVANDGAKDAWHSLGAALRPAMKGARALFLSAPQALFSHEISNATQLVFNQNHAHDFQGWLMRVSTLQKKITGLKNTLLRPGTAYDHRSARIVMNSLNTRLNELFLERPNQITARTSGSTKLRIGREAVDSWLADFGHAEASLQRSMAGTEAHMNRVKVWMSENMGSALPTLLLGLNIWNVQNTAAQAKNDGRFTADELRMLGANAAYAANALAALWVVPAWSRAGWMTMKVGDEILKVAQAGYMEWVREAKAATDGTRAAAASEFAAVSKGLIFRTVTWAALGAVAAGMEAWQISKEAERATSEEEKTLLTGKLYVTGGMTGVAAAQLLGATLGRWFAFAWVMSTPVTVLLAILGIAYLVITVASNHYKREGLRLWLYRCNWGKGAIAEWLKVEKGHQEQMLALMETLQRPSVVGKALYQPAGRGPIRWQGFWLQIQIPRLLAGKSITLQPAMVDKQYTSRDQIHRMPDAFYEQFIQGSWIDPKQLGKLPTQPGTHSREADYLYNEQDQHYLWQVWIETSIATPIIELEILYPTELLKRADSRGYLFRIALAASSNEADRINTAFSSKLEADDDIVLATATTRSLVLSMPNLVKGPSNV